MKPGIRLSLLAAGLAACAFAAQAQSKPAAKPAAPAAPAASAAQDAAAAAIISNSDFEKAGQQAAHAWLLLLDRKDWGTAWDASSSVFRQNVPLDRWMDNIPKVRQPLGAFVERKPGEHPIYTKTLPGRPDGDYVTIGFQSKFANKEVMEMVTTVRESDGRWRVTGYGVQ